jgi:hypothetical protein
MPSTASSIVADPVDWSDPEDWGSEVIIPA